MFSDDIAHADSLKLEFDLVSFVLVEHRLNLILFKHQTEEALWEPLEAFKGGVFQDGYFILKLRTKEFEITKKSPPKKIIDSLELEQ